MLLVLLSWLLIGVNLWGWGLLLCKSLSRWMGFDQRGIRPTDIVICGIIALLLLCNTLSLWIPVNDRLLWFFTPVALISGWLYKSEWLQPLKNGQLILQKHNWIFAVAAMMIVTIAMIETIGPCEIDDEAGYHLPLVRWIENYAVAPGIANIEDRMGFNPSIYMLNALFSMRAVVPGGSFDLNSFLFVVFGLAFLQRIRQFRDGATEYWLPAFFSTAALVFLFRAYLSAMDADFLNIYGGLYLLLLVIENLPETPAERPVFDKVLIPLWWVTLVSNKFSILLLGPIVAWQLWSLWKMHHKFFLLKIIVAGTAIIGCWMARNYYISGYLIYPLHFVDVFNVDWKVPKALTEGQYAYVAEYARTEETRPFNTYVIRDVPWSEWWTPWLQRLWDQLIGKVLIIGLPMGIAGVLLFAVISKRWRKQHAGSLLLWAFLLLAAFIWWLRIPAVRFAWPWLLGLLVLSFGLVCHRLIQRHIRVFKGLLMVVLLVSLTRSSLSSVLEFPQWANYWQNPYPVDEGKAKAVLDWSGIQLRLAPDNFCRGLEPPCLPLHYHPNLQLRGKSIAEGFKIVE